MASSLSIAKEEQTKNKQAKEPTGVHPPQPYPLSFPSLLSIFYARMCNSSLPYHSVYDDSIEGGQSDEGVGTHLHRHLTAFLCIFVVLPFCFCFLFDR